MPDLTTYGRDPFPTGPEAAWVPGDFMAYAESIDPKLVLKATSQADRDSRYAGIGAGALVACAALHTVWLSLGGGAWDTVYSSVSTTVGFSYPSADWAAGAYQRVKTVNGVTDLRMNIALTGPPIITTGDGNIPDTYIATIPVAYAPLLYRIAGVGFYGGFWMSWIVDTSGSVAITSGNPDTTFATGGSLSISATWLAG